MNKKLLTGNWKLAKNQNNDILDLTISFEDKGCGTLSINSRGGGYLCSTFYAHFSINSEATNFELEFARGRVKGHLIIDSFREMNLVVNESSLEQIPLGTNGTEWQLVRMTTG